MIFFSLQLSHFQFNAMAILSNLPTVFLLFFAFHLSDAQIPANITLGSSLTAGNSSSWRSVSGDFAFGFYRISTARYVVGVWFDQIPERTLVWSANRNRPAEAGSTVRLTFNGQLLLTYNNGSIQTIYNGAAAALGFMQNDGNFVLRAPNSRVLWQSFDSPTNTLLPAQIFSADGKLYSNSNGTLDYSTGNFMLEMQYDGNLVLSAYHFSDPGYWYTNTTSNNVSLVFNGTTALMYLVNSTGYNIHNLTDISNVTTPAGEFYHRATINDNGNFEQFVRRRTNGSRWVRVWRAITEPCTVNAICGVYGFCSSPDNETVVCNCLPGYTPLDPRNIRRGCRPETVVNYCADPSARNFTVEVINDADFPLENFADLARVRNVDVEGCKKAVMDDCYTMAASLSGTTCNKKRTPLLNARRSASTLGIKALIKVPTKEHDQGVRRNASKKKSYTRLYLGTGFLTSLACALFSIAAAAYYHPTVRHLIQKKLSPESSAIGINFREFTYQELREATNGFSKSLGRGSTAKVYSGVLKLNETQVPIAVKKLEKVIERSEKEFMTELKIIGRTHHKNLVRLLGFCAEDNHRVLVYELMKNGTLSDFLFKEGQTPSWSRRSKMVVGIARGLLYLHEESETQIIHCDIKPQNVLLDSNFVPKIADFGLSKLLNKNQTRTETGARGTVGYMAPEWLKNAPVTSKVDVYSYGVLAMEICCGRRHVELSRVEDEDEDEDLVLVDWVVRCLRMGKAEVLVRHEPEVVSDLRVFERYLMVALWCVNYDPILRPSMKKVNQMLEGSIEVEIPPILQYQ